MQGWHKVLPKAVYPLSHQYMVMCITQLGFTSPRIKGGKKDDPEGDSEVIRATNSSQKQWARGWGFHPELRR